MSSSRSRGVLHFIWTNFVDSLSRKRFRKRFVGTDVDGNRYYELTHSTRSVKRGFIANKESPTECPPPEWLTWLRGLRSMPPTAEEIDARLKRAHDTPRASETGNVSDVPHVQAWGDSDWKSKPQDYPRYSDYDKFKL